MLDLQETLGIVIRRERRRQGLTLKTLAERSALSVVYLGEIEHGKKYPSARVLEQLARALDLDIPELLQLVAADLRGDEELASQAPTPIGFVPRERKSIGPRASMERESAGTSARGTFFIVGRGHTEGPIRLPLRTAR